MVEYSRRVRNSIVGLQTTGIKYSIPEKLDALSEHIWSAKSENGSRVTDVIGHILYGGPDDLLPERLWEAVAVPNGNSNAWALAHTGSLLAGRCRTSFLQGTDAHQRRCGLWAMTCRFTFHRRQISLGPQWDPAPDHRRILASKSLKKWWTHLGSNQGPAD